MSAYICDHYLVMGQHLKVLAVTFFSEWIHQCMIFLFILSPSDSLCSGETNEGMLVPKPLCQAYSAAHQEDPRQDSQLSGKGQGVVRGCHVSEAAAWCQGLASTRLPVFC